LIGDTAWHELIVGRDSMADAMLDARQEGDSYRRIEVITGQRRRRRWTAQEKARIVAESFEEGANISGRAPQRRRPGCHGVATGCSSSTQPGAASCRSGLLRSGGGATGDLTVSAGADEIAGEGIVARQAGRSDRDRGERGAGPGRVGSGADDALDGAVGAARRPVIALRADLKVVLATQPVDFRKSVHTLSALVSGRCTRTVLRRCLCSAASA
jgi:hypothetical protein